MSGGHKIMLLVWGTALLSALLGAWLSTVV